MNAMIREAIIKALKDKKISQRKCALDNGVIQQAFNSFLRGVRALPFDDLEKILQYLGLEIRDKDDVKE